MPSPSNKRRRLELDAGREEAVKLVERDPTEIRASLQDLHSSLDELGDIVVVVQGESSSSEFPCVRALLAQASRPLRAMLYGPMRQTSQPSSSAELPQLRLSMTEPGCFDKLLRWIHWRSLPLDIETALQLHSVADFYEVLPLRDYCCDFLLTALKKDNCCYLLRRSEDVNCEELTQRCVDKLTLDFAAVLESDSNFAGLHWSVLNHVLRRDELVVADEIQVFQSIVHWYSHEPSQEKYRQLMLLLPLVRWSQLTDKQLPEVNDIATRLQRPPPSKDGSSSAAPGSMPLDRIDAQQHALEMSTSAQKLAQGLAAPLTEFTCPLTGEKMRDPVVASDGCSYERSAIEPVLQQRRRAVSRVTGEHLQPGLADNVELRQRIENYDELVELWSRERQLIWGHLVGRTPTSPPGPAAPELNYTLRCTKSYMVGRSRKSDIRIGHTSPMPYISSQHFKLYHAISWPKRSAENSHLAPRVSAWLQDLSQNGTFINGKLVGRGKQQSLEDGDKVELVFPEGRMPSTPNTNDFPVFTFNAWKPVTDGETRPSSPGTDVPSDAAAD